MMSTMELEGPRTDAPPSVKRCRWSPKRWAISLASLLAASCGHFDIEHPPLCSHLLGSLCIKHELTGSRDVTATKSIITSITSSMVGDDGCTEIGEQANGPSLCILAYRTITVSGRLRASGPSPLVLVAAESISISGNLDVSSEAGGDPAALGAGARDCSSVDADGPPGGPNPPAEPDGGGGGAGGSLGSLGGAGGMSGRRAMEGGQPSHAAMPPGVLVGGCAGGNGGEGVLSKGVTASGDTPGGFGGGAVYVLAGASISISGQINASGAGGMGGICEGHESCNGGGGGGSGGMIGLEAPSIDVTDTGVIYANGGGGGGGGGAPPDDNQPPTHGLPGSRSTGPKAALGGVGGISAGRGGDGSASASAGMPGETATPYPQPAGGGGGGGGGVIHVSGTAPGSLGGMISPPAQ